MKVVNAIKGFEKAGFTVTEWKPGTFRATKDGYHAITFYKNGSSDEIVSAYYLAPDHDPPYPHSLKQAIKWAEKKAGQGTTETEEDDAMNKDAKYFYKAEACTGAPGQSLTRDEAINAEVLRACTNIPDFETFATEQEYEDYECSGCEECEDGYVLSGDYTNTTVEVALYHYRREWRNGRDFQKEAAHSVIAAALLDGNIEEIESIEGNIDARE